MGSFEQYGWATASSAIFGSWLSRGAGTSISIGGSRLAVQAFAATVTFLQQTASGHVHHPASELTQKSKCTDLRQRAAARLFFFFFRQQSAYGHVHHPASELTQRSK